MPNSLFVKLCVLVCFAGMSSTAMAKCSIVEVEFYLENGFSQEQITSLCGIATSGTRECAPSQPADLTSEEIDQICKAHATSTLDCSACPQQSVIGKNNDVSKTNVAVANKNGFNQKEQDAIHRLTIGGEVSRFDVNNEDINYTWRTCVLSGDSLTRGKRKEYCHGINYTVSRHGLQVRAKKKLPIIGAPIALLEGKVHLEFDGSIDSYPFEIRSQLRANLNEQKDKNTAEFPVRKGVSVPEIINALQSLAK